MKIKKIYILLWLFLCLNSGNSFAQKIGNQFYFVSPGASIGYTFGAGIKWGFNFDLGLKQNELVNSWKYGVSFSYYFVSVSQGYHYKRSFHRLRSTNLMLKNNFIDVKMGLGRARNKWGYDSRNGCIVHGFNIDLSFAYPNRFSPWVGLKSFRYKDSNWRWFDKPYTSVYIKYNADELMQNKMF